MTSGTCTGTCMPTARTCNGAQPQTCDATGTWQNTGQPCGTCQTCAMATGTCAPVTNGTPCSDGNGCTVSDTCQSGTCTPGTLFTCPAPPVCRTAGTCLPASGMCTYPNITDNTSCGTGGLGRCVSGSCNTACSSDSQCNGLFCVAAACTRIRETPMAAVALSGDGNWVVGGAVRWMVGAAATSALTGVPAGFLAIDVNNDGTMVVGGRTRWTAPSTILTLTFPGPEWDGIVSKISGNGTTMLGDANDGGGDAGFMWKAPGFTPLTTPGLPGAGETDANAVSDDGAIAVGRSRMFMPVVIGTPIWWPTTAGAVANALSVPAGASGSASAISGNGLVAVGSAGGPVRWSGVGFPTRLSLQLLSSSGTPSGGGNAVSFDGAVIVGSSSTSATTTEAVLWNATGAIQRIADILTASGVSLTGWTLTSATDVSSNGKTVIGNGTLNGVAKTWIARLP